MRSFLSLLYPEGLPDGTSLTLWVKEKGHRYPSSLDNLVERAAKEKDVYFTCGLQPEKYRKGFRAKASAVLGIPGLWLDLDFAKQGSAKLYPTEKQARKLIGDLPAQPTVVVHSGGGLHLWWLLHEVEVFESDEERDAAAGALRGWAKFIQGEAKKRDFAIDSTHDLSRVLRLPGTRNHSYDPPRSVKVESDNGPRYNLSEFEAWALPPGQEVPELDSFTLGSSDEIDPLLEALCSAEPKIRKTWERDRPDLDDQSPSSYDLSLANDAVACGLTPQEVADLLVSFRRYHGEPIKHHGYYELTIGKASSLIRDEAKKAASVEVALESVEKASGPEDAMRTIRKLTGSSVQRIVVYGVPEDPLVVLQFEHAMVPLGGGFEKLIQQPAWESACMAARSEFQRLPATTTKKGVGWDTVKKLFTQAWVEGQKVTDAKAQDWVECAAQDIHLVLQDEAQVSGAIEAGDQFVHNGHLYLRIDYLLRIAKQRGARYGTTAADIQVALEMFAEYESTELTSESGIRRRYEVFDLEKLPQAVTQHLLDDHPSRHPASTGLASSTPRSWTQ